MTGLTFVQQLLFKEFPTKKENAPAILPLIAVLQGAGLFFQNFIT